jgi:hypothetical protein
MSNRLSLLIIGSLLLPALAHAAPRGYLTTPEELAVIREKAERGIEPYQSNVAAVLDLASQKWSYDLRANVSCSNADDPAWNDNGGGTRILMAKAIAYHLMDSEVYAAQAKDILERIMTGVWSISLDSGQCRLNFGWGTPELVAAADLIEDYWADLTCTGPTSTVYGDNWVTQGPCKKLFQNWLVKNPYYVVSYAGRHSMSNWGAAATNTMARVADYLHDRPEVRLVHRNPRQVDGGRDVALSPLEAYDAANQLALDRMNGYGVELGSNNTCDRLSGDQQHPSWPPVKSQITERGIISEDARRSQFCNVPSYNGHYQNYPQIHLGNNIEQCELMRRRGDMRCFDNVETSNLTNYTYVDPDGVQRETHLRPGRGSIERAIWAVIVNSDTEWRKTSALAVAYRYYFHKRRMPGFEQWEQYVRKTPGDCSQDVCFGTLTHGFAPDETPPHPEENQVPMPPHLMAP